MMNLKLLQKLLLLLLNCYCTSLYAQSPADYKTRDSLIKKSIDNLHQKNIDTMAIYSEYTNLDLLPNCRSDQFPNYDPKKYEPCSSKENFLVFILWKKHGQSFFTFKTSCYDYPIKPMQDKGLWDYYLAKRIAIENDKPKEPLLKHVNLETEEITIGRDTRSYKEQETNQFIFLVGNNKTTKNMGYRLYQQYSNIGDQNLNYGYNINLPAKQLQKKLEVLCRPLVVSRELITAVKI
ncbi:MAG: hypothetical protein EOP45_09465 [Sphingobacteriaceae bacterium]|nr:MAG: hypothetical protein EOP45_09465 [Sphingobacteriaceae bacterium]